jgi:hypothetical protein
MLQPPPEGVPSLLKMESMRKPAPSSSGASSKAASQSGAKGAPAAPAAPPEPEPELVDG